MYAELSCSRTVTKSSLIEPEDRASLIPYPVLGYDPKPQFISDHTTIREAKSLSCSSPRSKGIQGEQTCSCTPYWLQHEMEGRGQFVLQPFMPRIRTFGTHRVGVHVKLLWKRNIPFSYRKATPASFSSFIPTALSRLLSLVITGLGIAVEVILYSGLGI